MAGNAPSFFQRARHHVDSANVKERELPEESQVVEETQVVVEKALEKVAEQVVEEAAIKEMPYPGTDRGRTQGAAEIEFSTQ